MSREDKQKIYRAGDQFMQWVTRGAVLGILWFLTQIYSDFKQSQKDIDEIKQKVSALSAAVDLIERYDLRAKK